MLDLEDLLRDEANRRSVDLEPSPDLKAQILGRIHRAQRTQKIAAGALAGGLVAAGVAVVVLVATGTRGDSLRTTDDNDRTDSTTSVSTSTTTASTTTTAGPGEEPRNPTSPAIGPDTPLSRDGVGPIRFGMTVREAEAAAGVSIVAPGGSRCSDAWIEGVDDVWLAFRVELPDSARDPKDAVIRSVSGGPSTEEGLAVGDPAQNVIALYGDPTQEFNSGAGDERSTFWVFEAGGYAYRVYTDGVEVLSLGSAEAEWITTFDPCSG